MTGRYQHGDVMNLIWEYGPEQFYIRGHIPLEEAKELFDYEYGFDYEFSDPEPKYGRWSTEPGPEGCGQILRIYAQPGRGRFPIMVSEVLKVLKYERS